MIVLDYPPQLGAYLPAAPSGEPDTRSPGAFLRWLISYQRGPFSMLVTLALVWMLPMTFSPWIIGRTIDRGILPHDTSATVRWVGLLLILTTIGSLVGMLYHTFAVRCWLIALYGTADAVSAKSLQLGHVQARRTPAGEVLSVAGGDANTFGEFTEILSRAIANLLAYILAAVLVMSMSVPLGLLVLCSAPILVALGAPLLRPLSRWQHVQRSRDSDLTSLATDIVAGLRILRGIGGEDTFAANYARQSGRVRQAGIRAGIWQAAVDALGVGLSGLFVVILLWVGVREVVAGALSVGALVSLLGYGLFLLMPMRSFVEFFEKLTRARVAAAKTIGVLGDQPPWVAPNDTTRPDVTGRLHDLATGFTAQPGRLTMVVSADPDSSAALGDRLGRYLPREDDERLATTRRDDEIDLDELGGRKARQALAQRIAERREQAVTDQLVADQTWGVTLDGVDLSQLPIDVVRQHILVSDASPHLFAGTLQQAIDPHGRLSREQAEAALHAAAAEDVFDAMEDGWQGVLEERGRGLSGGQRQRVVLARALASDADILVLVEPTSAVDAHTETRIAHRLAAYREYRTTVVITASPLLLHHAQEVVLLEDGRAVATGSHTELLEREPRYRRVVNRAGVL